MFKEIVQFELINLPMYLLQALAILGIFAALLIFRGKSVLSNQKSSVLGIVFGLTSFLLTGLVSEWIQLDSKPYLRNDLLFLAGFLGGLRNASWAALLSWVGRIIFGGGGSLFWSGFDIFFIAYGAVFLRYLLFKDKSIESLSFQQAGQILIWRFGLVLLPIVFIFFSGAISAEVATSLVIRRILISCSISVFILYTIIFLLRSEVYRENKHLYDPASGLPNHRALQKVIEKDFFSSNSSNKSNVQITQTLFLVTIRNLYELMHEYNHDWVDHYFHKLGEKITSMGSGSSLLSGYAPKIYYFSAQSVVIILHDIDAKSVLEKKLAPKLLYQLRTLSAEENLLSPRLTLGVIDIKPHTKILNGSQFLRGIALMEAYQHEAVHYFESSIAEQINHDKNIRMAIEQWIANDMAPLWLQPKIHLSSGECVGAESLLRVPKLEDGQAYEAPLYILAIAKRYHLVNKLEICFVKTAINHMQSLPELKISVNLSPESLSMANFGELVCSLLQSQNVSPSNLVIEIIETDKLITTDEVLNNIAVMAKAGIGFSLDDFGSGYSSLSLMSKLPFSELKLDYAMISSIDQPRAFTAIVAAIDTARHYQVPVVAEGVETEIQKLQLVKMGITYGQGYLFAKAMPLGQFIKFVKKIAKP